MDKAALAINTTIVGLTVVFLALIILSLSISLLKKASIFEKKTGTNGSSIADEGARVQQISEDGEGNTAAMAAEDTELAAVITAAVLASISYHPDYKIRVKSIRRLPHTAPVWNSTGRMEQLANRL